MQINIEKNDVLQDYSTMIEEGLTCIMGPHASGKTSFLNHIYKTHDSVAFVQSRVPMFEYMTIEENIDTSLSIMGRKDELSRVIQFMDLEGCRYTLVKYASQEEKHRCAIAIELGSYPKIFLFDEPLVSMNTLTMIRVIRDKLHNIPVIMSIQHPRGDIFFEMTSVILMSRGTVVFKGPPGCVQRHFEKLGHPMTVHVGVHEYAIDVCKNIKCNELHKYQYKKELITLSIDSTEIILDGVMHNIMTTAFPLFIRELLDNIRNRELLTIRLAQSLLMSTSIGCFFLNIDNTNYQNKSSAIFVIVAAQMISSLYLYTFPLTLQYDIDRNKYSLIVYHVIKTCVEIPFQIVSSLVFSIIVSMMTRLTTNILSFIWILCAITLCSSSFGYCMTHLSENKGMSIAFVVPMMMTSGFIVNNNSMPVYMSWIRFVNPLYYGYSAISVIVWRNISIECGNMTFCPYGDDVMEYYDIQAEGNTMSLLGLFVMYRFLGYLCIMMRLYCTSDTKCRM
jgi:ABC-type multidrug transport system ATPase subunit/ABC-type multidrug transport system permease subunit